MSFFSAEASVPKLWVVGEQPIQPEQSSCRILTGEIQAGKNDMQPAKTVIGSKMHKKYGILLRKAVKRKEEDL